MASLREPARLEESLHSPSSVRRSARIKDSPAINYKDSLRYEVESSFSQYPVVLTCAGTPLYETPDIPGKESLAWTLSRRPVSKTLAPPLFLQGKKALERTHPMSAHVRE